MNLRLSQQTFKNIQAFLSQESGIHIRHDRIDEMEEKIKERMESCRLENFDDYLHYLKFHPRGMLELRALIDNITIGETYFFRILPQFDAFRDHVLPELIARKMSVTGEMQDGKYGIRIWCAGCSSGEEPYSIAMIVKESLPNFEAWDVRILATDINRNVLKAANAGLYSQRAVQYVPSEYIDKYFARKGSRYQLIDKKIKDMVNFQSHNLVRDPYTLPNMQGLDVIFCRNVLIYFDASSIKQVISKFADCLVPNGYLFIGPAETLSCISDAFRLVEFPGTFIYRKRPEGEEREIELPVIPSPMVPSTVEVKEKYITPPKDEGALEREEAAPIERREAFDAFERKEYEKALNLFDLCLKMAPDDVNVLMAKGTIYANLGEYEKALQIMDRIVRIDNINAGAYYLQGVLFAKLKQPQKAVEGFRRALYVDPELAICYFYLGNMYQYLGAHGPAMKEYDNCLKILNKADSDEQLPLTEGLTADILRQAVYQAVEASKKHGDLL